MRRKLSGVIPCSQMSSPSTGQGSGGDRCTESVVSMIDCSYRLGPKAKTIGQPGVNSMSVAESVMYDLTEMLNHGSNVSGLENLGVWLPEWLKSNGYDKVISLSNTHNPSFADIKRVIDAGHIAVIGVNNYIQLHLSDGWSDPYAWPENAANAGGHVLLLTGYDTDYNGKGYSTVIVNDPLRADPSGMMVDYTYISLENAGFSDLTEVVGKPFTIVGDPVTPPAPKPANTTAECVDVSSWQGSINWKELEAWSKAQSHDGKSHVIMRASQGKNLLDEEFERNWSGAIAAGFDEIVVYHYTYPEDNSAQAEALWFHQVVGTRLRPNDQYMIDFEESVPQATDAWLLAFVNQIRSLTGKMPLAYMNLNFVQTRMRNVALAEVPLVLADWTFDENARPAVPAPFKQLWYIQFSDKGSVPGISGEVDLDVFVGPEPVAPKPAPVPPSPAPKPPVPPSPAPLNPLQKALDDALAQVRADQAQIVSLNTKIASQQKQIDGLNITLTQATSKNAELEQQLASEKTVEQALQDHVNLLVQQMSTRTQADHESIVQEVQEIVADFNNKVASIIKKL